jgi:RNA polymerase sigma factor (sigma-70 family)
VEEFPRSVTNLTRGKMCPQGEAVGLAQRMAYTEVTGDTDDALLARAAADGDSAAFDELYRRHSDSAWRVAYSVTGNRDDAADAVADAFTRMFAALTAGRLADLEKVRPYLLSTTRNAAIDVLRRNGRLQPLDDSHLENTGPSSAGPSDVLIDLADASFVSSAFLSLPERWRSVLWLTEVEGMPAAEVGKLLGVSANNAAQLAVRARAGLRQRFLQAHVREEETAGQCSFTLDRLGAYVGGALAPRDIAKVDQHLAGCSSCRGVKDELDDLGSTLRRVAVPLPLALGALFWKHWRDAAGHQGVHKTVAAIPGSRHLTGTAVGLLGIGIIALGILGKPDLGLAGGTSPHPINGPAVGSNPVVLAEQRAAATPPAPALPLAVPGLTTPVVSTTASGPASSPATGGSNGSGSGGSSAPVGVPPVTTASGPLVQISAQINLSPVPVHGSVGAGQGTGSSTGATVTSPVGTQSEGSPPASSQTSSSLPSATVSGTLPVVGGTSVSLP